MWLTDASKSGSTRTLNLVLGLKNLNVSFDYVTYIIVLHLFLICFPSFVSSSWAVLLDLEEPL
jgi:hypothetical protein